MVAKAGAHIERWRSTLGWDEARGNRANLSSEPGVGAKYQSNRLVAGSLQSSIRIAGVRSNAIPSGKVKYWRAQRRGTTPYSEKSTRSEFERWSRPRLQHQLAFGRLHKAEHIKGEKSVRRVVRKWLRLSADCPQLCHPYTCKIRQFKDHLTQNADFHTEGQLAIIEAICCAIIAYNAAVQSLMTIVT